MAQPAKHRTALRMPQPSPLVPQPGASTLPVVAPSRNPETVVATLPRDAVLVESSLPRNHHVGVGRLFAPRSGGVCPTPT